MLTKHWQDFKLKSPCFAAHSSSDQKEHHLFFLFFFFLYCLIGDVRVFSTLRLQSRSKQASSQGVMWCSMLAAYQIHGK